MTGQGAEIMPSDYAKTLGARLRAIRTQQGLSLHGVEEKSRGRWKAVVVGSYERGDRAVTVQKLAELAEVYGVPGSGLPAGDATPAPLEGRRRRLLRARSPVGNCPEARRAGRVLRRAGIRAAARRRHADAAGAVAPARHRPGAHGPAAQGQGRH